MGSRAQEKQPSQEQIDELSRQLWSQMARLALFPGAVKVAESVRQEMLEAAIELARKCAAEERKACAKIADQLAKNWWAVEGPAVEASALACQDVAMAIRARGIDP